MIVGLIQVDYCKGYHAEECEWQTVFIIQKGNGDFRGIRLVEVLWKTVTGIPNCRLAGAIQYHKILHELHTDRGTGTAYLEAKMLQKLIEMSDDILYEIFLDMNKAYYVLERDCCMDILVAYGVVPQATCLLQWYWYQLKMVAWAGGDYGALFKGFRRATQGEQLPTTIFNVVVDVVL